MVQVRWFDGKNSSNSISVEKRFFFTEMAKNSLNHLYISTFLQRKSRNIFVNFSSRRKWRIFSQISNVRSYCFSLTVSPRFFRKISVKLRFLDDCKKSEINLWWCKVFDLVFSFFQALENNTTLLLATWISYWGADI